MTHRLSDVLRRLEPFVIGDEAVARVTADERRMAARAARETRRGRLERSTVRLTTPMLVAVVHDSLALKTPCLEAARLWAANAAAPPNIVLAGGVGCGKTVATAWVIAHSDERAVSRSAFEVARIFGSRHWRATDEQRAMAECGLLVIDDAGTELEHDVMGHALVEILEARKTRRARTIITTNMSRAKFLTTYPDPRIASRVTESTTWIGDPSTVDLRRQP